MIELKPCPFCGGKARLLAGNGVRVLCTKCGATTWTATDSERGGTSAVEDVIKAWNKWKNNFEVIDDTPNIAEVVEKYGEDVKRRLTRADILHAAEKCVCGQREQDYGTPEDNFETIAELWETYLRRACVDEAGDVYIGANDVAMMMALLKIARIAAGGGKADSWIDLAGYAACGAECEGVTE